MSKLKKLPFGIQTLQDIIEQEKKIEEEQQALEQKLVKLNSKKSHIAYA